MFLQQKLDEVALMKQRRAGTTDSGIHGGSDSATSGDPESAVKRHCPTVT